MAMTYPLTIAQFIDQLPIGFVRFRLPEAIEMSETAGGEIITDHLGTRLWRGTITMGKMTRAEAADAETLIDLVRGAGASFQLYRTTQPYPQADPTGALLGAAVPVINTIAADTQSISLSALPAGYELRRGDYLSFDYGTAPVRTALHRIVDLTVTADGSGVMPEFQVIPNIRPGATAATPVRLIKSYCKAIIMPGSAEDGTQNRFMTSGVSFDVIQTLR